LLVDLFRLCEKCAKPVIQQYVEPSIEAIMVKDPGTEMMATVERIKDSSLMPDWVKVSACNVLTPDMIAESRSHQIEKLWKLLAS
jgi:hypothetical protein